MVSLSSALWSKLQLAVTRLSAMRFTIECDNPGGCEFDLGVVYASRVDSGWGNPGMPPALPDGSAITS